jgi:hypothetical protein
MDTLATYTVFAGDRRIAGGDLPTILTKTKRYLDRTGAGDGQLLIFDDESGRQVEHDFRGTLEAMLARELPQPAAPGPGRPRLGVLSREVSLLPKHWEYLEAEPNGISAALRRLVEEAMKRNAGSQRARLAREAAGRFMTVMAGDRAGFEEASRALYAKDRPRFEQLIGKWPRDVREHLRSMAERIGDWS